MAAFAAVFAVLPLQQETIPFYVHMAGVLLAGICVFPLARWYAQGARSLPMFEIICLSYGVQYSLPLYLQPNQLAVSSGATVVFDWFATFRTLLLAGLGVASMIVAYYTVQRVPAVKKLPKVDLQMSDAQLSRYLAVAFIFGLGTSVLTALHLTPDNTGPLGFAVRLVSIQSFTAIALLTARVYSQKRSWNGWRYLLYIWVAASVSIGLASGSLENVFVPAVIVVLIRWQKTRRFPWRPLFAGAIVFLLLQPIKAEYRAQISNVLYPPGLTQKLTLWFQDSVDMVQGLTDGGVVSNAQTVSTSATSRLDLLHAFVLVDTVTPESVPYLGGGSYVYLAYSWVPRLLWPGKPDASDANNHLALTYGRLSQSQVGSAQVGLGQVTEAYANFGIFGVLLIMALQGVMYSFLNLLLNSARSEGGVAIYLAQMVWFLNGIGSSTAILLGGIVQGLLPSVLILKVFVSTESFRQDTVSTGSAVELA
ncbi:MAG: hypothetical protein DLM70_08770 [Chloroflexi bacterium]|nr:MAG: hypothetical protein DLM70_08770 [Chloroflexota bacterium]